jgi:hypothetical protein
MGQKHKNAHITDSNYVLAFKALRKERGMARPPPEDLREETGRDTTVPGRGGSRREPRTCTLKSVERDPIASARKATLAKDNQILRCRRSEPSIVSHQVICQRSNFKFFVWASIDSSPVVPTSLPVKQGCTGKAIAPPTQLSTTV